MSAAHARPRARGERRPRWLLAIITLLAIAGVAIFAFFFLFRLFTISSDSNLPTERKGDVIVGSKWAYGFSRFSLPIDLGFKGRILGTTPKRGDVALFVTPANHATIYIKRVIGLPGDSVQMKDGRLVLNGAVVPREPIAPVAAEGLDGKLARVPTYRETLPGGPSYEIAEVAGDMGLYDNTDVFRVPEDAIFVLGDNRDNSLDSRVAPDDGGLGFVPLDNLVARAELLLFSSAGGASARDRTLRPIR